MAGFSAITGRKVSTLAAVGVRVVGLGLCGLVLVGCPTGGTLEDPECFEDGGCGTGGGTDGGTGGTSASCDPAPIFLANCNTTICHGKPGTPPSLDIVDLFNPAEGLTLGASLLNLPATYPITPIAGDPQCPTATPELIIDGADPENSLLLNKVIGTAPGDFACGEHMPGSSVQISEADVACIRSWVTEVAANGG